jgi:plasmid stabilization system protein ParE
MTVRPPRNNAKKERQSALDYEIVQEQAAALGRLGRALEAALAALAEHDGLQSHRDEHPHGQTAESAVRARLLQEASNALWCFIVQREACGLRDQRAIMRDYRVPADVQNRMGIFGTTRPPNTS